MKDGIVVGMALGLIAGALLFKHSETARDLFNKGEKVVKQEVKEIKKKASPKKTQQ